MYCEHPMTDKLNFIGLKNINNFKHASKRKFTAYLELKTGGMDKVSRETEESLRQAVNDKNYNVICSYLSGKDILTCMRWFIRGISLGDAIRKVQVDLEVSENANKSSAKSSFY